MEHSVFNGVVFALESNIPSKQKATLKKLISSKGGTISDFVTAKVRNKHNTIMIDYQAKTKHSKHI